MSKKEKLRLRLLSRPRDFTFSELKTLLVGLGYVEDNRGKTSGSRVAFIHKIDGHMISIHKPHPKPQLKMYQIDLIIEELTKREIK